MFSFLKPGKCPQGKEKKSRTQIGWLLDTDKAGFIWPAPERIRPQGGESRHAKSISYCPAIIDGDARMFEITCPVDLHLRIQMNPGPQEPVLINAAGDQSTIRSKTLNSMISVVSRKEWRHPDRPIIQFITPYIFVSDDAAYIMQMPPINSYAASSWPGVLIGGRFPIHIWPRPMMWAFEWHDTNKELVVKRGDPFFYVKFETEDPSRPVQLVEAEMTASLKEYIGGLSAVTNYVNRTFSLFTTAKERRPKQLLVPKER
ncbi:MAG: hypothetical protein WC989_00880 [Micavibrio sp.]